MSRLYFVLKNYLEKHSYTVKTFEDPLDELKYVVTVNIRRRHLDEFQRAEVAIKYDKLYKKIARNRYTATQFNSKTAQAAVNKRYPQMPPEEDGEDDQEDWVSQVQLRGASGDAGRSNTDMQEFNRSSQELGQEFGVSASTIDRVKSILEHGTSEQIQSIREKSASGEKPGVRTMYDQVQTNKLKDRLQTEGGAGQEVKRDNLRLINKDFRTISHDDIPEQSVDLVLVLYFPEPRIREDEGFRVYEQLMQAGCDWLKVGGILGMHVQQRYLPRAISEKPPLLQFYHILSIDSPYYEHVTSGRTIFREVASHRGLRERRKGHSSCCYTKSV